MKKKVYKINTDKLRLSFIQPQELWDKLIQFPLKEVKKDEDTTLEAVYVNYEDFSLRIYDDGRGRKREKAPTKIMAQLILADNTLLGDFVFNNSAKYDGLCFFTFANSALYDYDVIINGEKANKIDYILYVADALNLQLNTITEIELSLDVNFNVIPKILKLIKDYENYDLFVNKKHIEDEKSIIEEYGEWFSRSRKKKERYPTIYVKQKKENQQLRIYNKSKEINEKSAKNYITEWDDFGKSEIHRLEISIKWENIQKWLSYLQDTNLPSEWKQYTGANDPETRQDYLSRTLCLIGLSDYRMAMWHYFAQNTLYFRHRGTNRHICLLDIALSEK